MVVQGLRLIRDQPRIAPIRVIRPVDRERLGAKLHKLVREYHQRPGLLPNT